MSRNLPEIPNKRFDQIQDEFFETSKRLRTAETLDEKLALLKELQRIVQETQQVLIEAKIIK